ncbi:MAG: Asp-tRNA(Asn)/Glu-tRNA(Gln) amidotransferase subunit GatC [Candidatus Kapabacteria bacterium]|jgi:aspartyl-tRNA(Asn)/glutamyl-tRNA(Gln) amidotransferase subunit C|nr:Asp-tRNA(Asn)/Glu-tRNA(Gln) amidotransferase subunit GatC [Candidatus Kapabacteria bacterium]
MKHDDIKAIADLAKLSFSGDDVERFAKQFDDIVSYVGVLSTLDIDDVAPQTHVHDTVNVLRDDVAGESLTTAEALANAPKKNEAFFKVPKVL